MTTQTLLAEDTQRLPSGDWYIDPARSAVRFHTRAMFGLLPVHGRFEHFRGELHVDESGRVSGELQIDAASIATGIGKRDEHLRHDDFFATDRNPHLTFTLAGLEPDGSTHRVSGTLHIRDRSIPIHTDARVRATGRELQIQGQLPVDHHSAGLGWAKPGLVRKVVQADVRLTLTPEPPLQ